MRSRPVIGSIIKKDGIIAQVRQHYTADRSIVGVVELQGEGMTGFNRFKVWNVADAEIAQLNGNTPKVPGFLTSKHPSPKI